ncbi:MAG: RNA polymerase sigma factor, partial [Nitrososphaerales archaeon]
MYLDSSPEHPPERGSHLAILSCSVYGIVHYRVGVGTAPRTQVVQVVCFLDVMQAQEPVTIRPVPEVNPTEMPTTLDLRQERFAELFHRHHTRILLYTRRRLPQDLAADALADTFLAAWRRLDDAPPDPLLWLYGLARRAVANQQRA